MKWVLLLPILYALQEVKGYPPIKYENYGYKPIRILPNTQPRSKVFSANNYNSNNFKRSWAPQLTLSFSNTYNNTLAYMTRKLELLEESYKQISECLKEIVDELIFKKEKKQPVTPESAVLNDNKQEHFNQTESMPDELIVTQTPVLIKHDVKEKSAEQGDKEDTITSIKNDENEETVFTTSTNQAETMITKNDKITEKPETLHENGKSQTTFLEEEPQSEASKSEENAQQSDNEKMMEEKDP